MRFFVSSGELDAGQMDVALRGFVRRMTGTAVNDRAISDAIWTHGPKAPFDAEAVASALLGQGLSIEKVSENSVLRVIASREAELARYVAAFARYGYIATVQSVESTPVEEWIIDPATGHATEESALRTVSTPVRGPDGTYPFLPYTDGQFVDQHDLHYLCIRVKGLAKADGTWKSADDFEPRTPPKLRSGYLQNSLTIGDSSEYLDAEILRR